MATPRSPLPVLVLASLALHGVALWAMEVDRGVVAARTRPQMELTWVEAEQPPALPPAPPSPHSPPPSAVKKKPVAAVPQAPSAGQASGAERPTAPEVAATATGTAGSAGERGDLPVAKGPDLTPGLGYVLGLPKAHTPNASAGSTVRNGPGEEPDPVIAKEYEGEKLTRKLNNDLLQEVGAAATAVGNVPGHFMKVQNTMRETLRKARVDRTADSTGDVLRDVARIALTPGISPEAARAVADSPLGRSVTNNAVMSPNAEDSRFREAATQMLAASQEIQQRMHAPKLKTVLEMTCDPSGALADVTVVERSGDERFDESVIHLSRKVFRTLPDNDDKALGTSWWKSRWQFTYEPPDVKVRLLLVHRITPANPQ